jgi:hypothetical protein
LAQAPSLQSGLLQQADFLSQDSFLAQQSFFMLAQPVTRNALSNKYVTVFIFHPLINYLKAYWYYRRKVEKKHR